jgi:hypothetical protein
MATNFTSLRVKLAAYVGGALTVIGAMAVTGTLTGTTGQFTTLLEAPTMSGTTINALQANGIVKARTLSGAALNLGGSGLATNKVLCVKSTGVIGFYTRSGTGTLTESTCQ